MLLADHLNSGFDNTQVHVKGAPSQLPTYVVCQVQIDRLKLLGHHAIQMCLSRCDMKVNNSVNTFFRIFCLRKVPICGDLRSSMVEGVAASPRNTRAQVRHRDGTEAYSECQSHRMIVSHVSSEANNFRGHSPSEYIDVTLLPRFRHRLTSASQTSCILQEPCPTPSPCCI
jgi:hypothetical protein